MDLRELLLITLALSLISPLCCSSNLGRQAIPYDDSAYPLYFGHGLSSAYHPNRFLLTKYDQMSISKSSKMITVVDYGAKGDGMTDDAKAFEKAWEAACSSSGSATIMVPAKKTYFLKLLTLSGPCNSNISMMIKGTIEAPSDQSAWNGGNQRHWILFKGISNLKIGGGGTINGNGQIWWNNSCKINKALPCKNAPTAMTFSSCNNLRVENLVIKDSQQIHLSFEECNNVVASSLTISASGTSPNTDGIHVAQTKSMQISDCTIGTGDDCISIETGSQGIRATNIVCGPGHGISIGSLGDDDTAALQVSGVTVDTATLSGTTNGVRIKTWQGGSGYAKNIAFQNIIMKDVANPIIIDQNYCDSHKPCTQQVNPLSLSLSLSLNLVIILKKSAVEVSNVVYKNIKGTSSSDVAIKFDCSASVPCNGIKLQDIDLTGGEGRSVKILCNNVKMTKVGSVLPPTCN